MRGVTTATGLGTLLQTPTCPGAGDPLRAGDTAANTHPPVPAPCQPHASPVPIPGSGVLLWAGWAGWQVVPRAVCAAHVVAVGDPKVEVEA